MRSIPCTLPPNEPACIHYNTPGQKLKRLRSAADMGVRQLAKALDVSATFISNVENGKAKIPFRLAGRAAVVLNCNVADIIYCCPTCGQPVNK